MPAYCYEMDDGEIIERVFPVGKAPKTLTARRCFAAERKGLPPSKGWPMTCVASGVNASQADELRKHFQQVGVPTEVTSDGDPIYRDAKHRKKALKARGFVDRSSFM